MEPHEQRELFPEACEACGNPEVERRETPVGHTYGRGQDSTGGRSEGNNARIGQSLS